MDKIAHMGLPRRRDNILQNRKMRVHDIRLEIAHDSSEPPKNRKVKPRTLAQNSQIHAFFSHALSENGLTRLKDDDQDRTPLPHKRIRQVLDHRLSPSNAQRLDDQHYPVFILMIRNHVVKPI